MDQLLQPSHGRGWVRIFTGIPTRETANLKNGLGKFSFPSLSFPSFVLGTYRTVLFRSEQNLLSPFKG